MAKKVMLPPRIDFLVFQHFPVLFSRESAISGHKSSNQPSQVSNQPSHTLNQPYLALKSAISDPESGISSLKPELSELSELKLALTGYQAERQDP